MLVTEARPQRERALKEGRKNELQYGWNTLLISLLGVVCLGVVTAFYRRRFSLLTNVFFNWKLSKQIIRYEKVHTHPVNILLLLLFLSFFPLYYSLSISELYPRFSFDRLLKNISLFLILYFLIKFLLYRFSAWLFEEKALFNQYIFQLNLYTKFMGILLLMLWILQIYSPIPALLLFKISLGILLLFLVLQTFSGMVIGRSEGRSLFLIILYLCALEILPWLLIVKSLKNNW